MRASRRRAALLPSALRIWPAVLWRGSPGADAAFQPADAVAAALKRIRCEMLYWPAPRAAAAAPRVLAIGDGGLAAARAGYADADILCSNDPADVDPARLEAVFGAPGRITLWARMGGIATPQENTDPATLPAPLLATAVAVSPWTGGAMTLTEAVEAQSLLRHAAMRARGPVALVGMSAWKRRCLRPFLTGPDGPPRVVRRLSDIDTQSGAQPVALWGAAAAAGALRIEDGFLRSVGLGLRHTPPVSLTLDRGAPYFDATQPNAFEATVAAATFTPDLLARAARLRRSLIALRLTKYNLAGAEPPPDAGGREAVLVAGQVAGDASIRLGARAVRGDLDLLRATRTRHPDAFLLYKPHPDVMTGLREGAADLAQAQALADAVAGAASAADCLDWADRVATITSLMGFEALLRGKKVTTFGRPFYAGWGLTDDADPPPRPVSLTLDALTAAALILYPAYVDPATGLPAPPEIAIQALARARDGAGRPGARLLRLWRDAISWGLNRL